MPPRSAPVDSEVQRAICDLFRAGWKPKRLASLLKLAETRVEDVLSENDLCLEERPFRQTLSPDKDPEVLMGRAMRGLAFNRRVDRVPVKAKAT